MKLISWNIDRIVRYIGVLVCVLAIGLVGCASDSKQVSDEEIQDTSQQQQLGLDPVDPWESLNRRIFSFNDFFDRNLLKPAAQGYVYITPGFFRSGVSNVFSNLIEPVSLVNNLLQGDMEGAITTSMRLATNTTLGFFGLFDVATEVGMRKDAEDFGQTLGVWGVDSGYYIVIPFFGPSSTRDVFSYVDGIYYNRYWPIKNNDQKNAAIVLRFVNLRASLLDLEKQLDNVDDKYLFIRDVWLQRREFLLNDGEISQDDFGGEGEDEEDFNNLDDDF